MPSSLVAIPERSLAAAYEASSAEQQESASDDFFEEPVAIERSLSEWWRLEERQPAQGRGGPGASPSRPVSITEFDGLGNSAQFSLRCERDGCATPRIKQDGSIAMDEEEEVGCGGGGREEDAFQETPVRQMHLPGHDRYAAVDDDRDGGGIAEGSEGAERGDGEAAISSPARVAPQRRHTRPPSEEATKERSFWQKVVEVLMPLCADAGAWVADLEHGSFVQVPVHMER